MSDLQDKEPEPRKKLPSEQDGFPNDAALTALIRQVAEQVADEREEAARQPFWKRTPFMAAAVGVMLFLGARLGVDNFANSPHIANLLHDALGTELALTHNIALPENRLKKAIGREVDNHLASQSVLLTDLIAEVVRNKPFMAFHGRHVFGPEDFEHEVLKLDTCPAASNTNFVVDYEESSECKVIRVTEYNDFFDMPFFAKPQDSITILLALENKRIDFRTFDIKRTRIPNLHKEKIMVSIDGEPVQLKKLKGILHVPSLSSVENTDFMLFAAHVSPDISTSKVGDAMLGVSPRLRLLEILASDTHPRDHFTGAAIIVLVNPD